MLIQSSLYLLYYSLSNSASLESLTSSYPDRRRGNSPLMRIPAISPAWKLTKRRRRFIIDSA
jgi:hypothetical protein